MPLVWLAARNGLLAATFALLGVSAHLRWRTDGWRPGTLLGPLGLALGLASNEQAVSVFAYAHAFELPDADGAARWLPAPGEHKLGT